MQQLLTPNFISPRFQALKQVPLNNIATYRCELNSLETPAENPHCAACTELLQQPALGFPHTQPQWPQHPSGVQSPGKECQQESHSGAVQLPRAAEGSGMQPLSCSKVQERTKHGAIWHKPQSTAGTCAEGLHPHRSPAPTLLLEEGRAHFRPLKATHPPPGCLYPTPGAQGDI